MSNNLERMKKEEAFAWYHMHMPNEMQNTAKNLCREYSQLSNEDAEGKQAILKKLFGSCTDFTFIASGFQCDYGFNIFFHGMAVVNHNVTILDTSPVHIGHEVFIGPHTCISCAGHALHMAQRAKGVGTTAPITIENGVWIGANVTVCPGVTIGEGSVIAAGSVVTKDIPKGVLAAGVPAKVIREITEDDLIPEEEIY